MKSIARWVRCIVVSLVVGSSVGLNPVTLAASAAEPEKTTEAAPQESETIHATISKSSVNLRSAPDIHSKPGRIRLNKGDVVIVRRASEPGWYEIQLPTPFKGFFVREDLLTLDKTK